MLAQGVCEEISFKVVLLLHHRQPHRCLELWNKIVHQPHRCLDLESEEIQTARFQS